ncbi:MAG TPA: peptidase C14 [Cyanobacteria bacterium UBA11149]|nr:peptidase C14 [Cyanobacteria bacterium UBA11367]HBE57258.1 peptidase C14 [Cyanobacteria bacterium UBA11366]HBR73635.1 peptidase C14 [Cyanobacteria bacterium UBA11159]HBS69194.1 peptidase C14 [Cyanobacteria bacterium UBA11153]HBW91090.1 peptidase C14 [Cyanobacteria bacterium UBA11149]HCA96550.1 peptidase C14 [Cyanobacteria bacterium UBA9226]
MTPTTRRHFLQFVGSALAAIGLNQVSFLQSAQRYGKVLAQSTPRKLALLVGINSYVKQPLEGCINDLDLQQYLLIHRFGFNPKDIYILSDEKATRGGILTAFEEHLIKQAKPGDVVVYHYSGHGSQILDPHPIVVEPGKSEGLAGTFVPVDGNLPNDYPNVGGEVTDITGHTLFLLMSALKTENVTAILDSCFSGGATRDVKVRSRDGGKKILVSDVERSYQVEWLSRLNLSPEEFIEGYRKGVAKGVVLAATSPNQLAREETINSFKCGLFTYLLTHYLWQSDGNIASIFQKILPEIPRIYRQTPLYEVKVGSGYERGKPYFINRPNSAAEAVVIEIKGDNVKLWLGGVDLRKVNPGTLFTAVKGIGQVRVLSRDGIVTEAKIEKAVTVGMGLRLMG